MAKLFYSTSVSLDGYVADKDGSFEWTAPDEAVHAFINDKLRNCGTHLYGRRLYEVMAVWETLDTGPGQTAVMRDFAGIWRAVDKVVYSRTLDAVSSARTRIERDFDPEAVRGLKAEATRDLLVGGPTLAANAFGAGLIDEVSLFVVPFVVGGGLRALPDDVRLRMELLDERRFASGTVYLNYRVL